jgi:hypothetical protein
MVHDLSWRPLATGTLRDLVQPSCSISLPTVRFPIPFSLTMADQPTTRPASSFPTPKPSMNPFLTPQPRPASIATDIPYVAPPAYPHEQSYPQTGVKSEFDSDGIEFLKPIEGDRGEPPSFPTEKMAWDVRSPPETKGMDSTPTAQYYPQKSCQNPLTTPNRVIGFQPPGPPPARPTRPPSSQIWAPLPHNPAYHQGYAHGNPYHEPNIGQTPYLHGGNEAGLTTSKKPPIKTAAKVFKICCEPR